MSNLGSTLEGSLLSIAGVALAQRPAFLRVHDGHQGQQQIQFIRIVDTQRGDVCACRP
jgi:hypothetical protein